MVAKSGAYPIELLIIDERTVGVLLRLHTIE